MTDENRQRFPGFAEDHVEPLKKVFGNGCKVRYASNSLTGDTVGTNIASGHPARPGRPLSSKEVNAIYDSYYKQHGRRVPPPKGGK